MTSTPESAETPESPVGDETTTDAGTAEATETVAPEGAEVTAEAAEPDARLLAAHDLARAALAEITDVAAVGAQADSVVEVEGLVSLRFASTLRGYPGWFWTVTVGVIEGAEPTVLELGLLPGDDALVAPEWVPWAERLAGYQAAAGAEEDEAEGDADDDGLDDVDDLDADDFDADGSEILHSGDVDGVDIDELDAARGDEGTENDDES